VRSPKRFVKNGYSKMPAARGCGIGRRLCERWVAGRRKEEGVKNSVFLWLNRRCFDRVGWGISSAEGAAIDWLECPFRTWIPCNLPNRSKLFATPPFEEIHLESLGKDKRRIEDARVYRTHGWIRRDCFKRENSNTAQMGPQISFL